MKNVFNHGLIKGGIILTAAFGLFNFFHFLFQFFMARMLTVADYGALATLLAIVNISSVISESVQTIITKYSTNENQKGRLKNLLKKSAKKAAYASCISFGIYLLLAIPLSILLKMDYTLISMTGLVIFTAFFTPLVRGLMQGKKRFFSLGANLLSESVGKMALGIFFVYLGWKVYGAVAAIIMGSVVSILLSLWQLRDIIKMKEEKYSSAGIYDYAKPAFFITAVVIVFYSIDIVMARILFSFEVAGSYALASILGKVIFWGTLPVGKAMFPLSAENKQNKTNNGNVFMSSLSLVLVMVIIALFIFYFFPGAIIGIFSGKPVPDAVSVLLYTGIAFGFVSITNLILLHKLSLDKTRNYPLLAIFILIEIGLLTYFSKDILQFSIAFITSSIAFLLGAILLLEE